MIVDLHLRGNLVIIVGSGKEGIKKINLLLKQDCKILVISKSSNKQIEKFVKSGKIQFKKLKLKNVDFISKYKPFLVMATTNDKTLNEKIVKKAKKMKLLAYASDSPEISDFAQTSTVNIDDAVQIAISTYGSSPVMAKKIKMKAENFFKKNISKFDINQIQLQKFARNEAKHKLLTSSDRKEFLYSIINDKHVKELLKDGKYKSAQTKVKKMLRELS